MQFIFKEFVEPVYSDDLYYDFFDGGYINEVKLLEDKEQVKKVREARMLIEAFLDQAERAGVLELG